MNDIKDIVQKQETESILYVGILGTGMALSMQNIEHTMFSTSMNASTFDLDTGFCFTLIGESTWQLQIQQSKP